MKFRQGGDVWGSHRVLGAKKLPQEAGELDASLPPYENEILVSVEKLQIDSASFSALKSEVRSTKSETAIGERILDIVKERGKMHNPVTNSGGVFMGTIEAVGPKHPMKDSLSPGDRVVSLVSLTLTPLFLEKVEKVDLQKAQIFVQGSAIVFASGILKKMPADLPEGVVLAALDVCGAPAQIKRLVREGDKVLIIGLGKSGKVMAAQARKMGALVLGVDLNDQAVSWCRQNIKGHYTTLDATDAVSVNKWVSEITRGSLADVSVNAVSVEGSEMSSILSCRDGGRVLFFGMATSFQKAALGAEGAGKDVMMIIGNGYVPGHAEVILDLLREDEALRGWFGEKYEV